MSDNPLLTVAEAMARLSLSRSSIERLVRQGKLMPRKLGRAARVTRASVERLEQIGCRQIRERAPALPVISAS